MEYFSKTKLYYVFEITLFSFECGLLSGGAVLSTVDRVMADCRSGIAIVRPPGHHAEQV